MKSSLPAEWKFPDNLSHVVPQVSLIVLINYYFGTLQFKRHTQTGQETINENTQWISDSEINLDDFYLDYWCVRLVERERKDCFLDD